MTENPSTQTFNTKEFSYSLIYELPISQENIFQYNCSKVKLSQRGEDLEIISTLKTLEHQYLSLIEKNTNSMMLRESINLDINDLCHYKVKLTGEKEGAIDVQLALIFYSDKEKIFVEFLSINQEQIITPKPKSEKMRLAIRLAGSGSCILKSIQIYQAKQIDFMDIHYLRKLGFDMPRSLKELKVACIFDDFTMNCFKGTCQLLTFTPYNWKAIFSINMPHILLVESAWEGNFGSWRRKIGFKTEESIKELVEVVNWCKANNIPTVFWNKEDPVHFNTFIETAKYFDFVFTTERDCINKYREILKHDRVDLLLFAAQPRIHNPIKLIKERKNKICYAGSYYAAKYPERQADLERLINIGSKYGVDIYDRHYGDNYFEFLFPDKYSKYIIGTLQGEEIQRAYKGYRVILNLNSTKDSSTMFSRRVFEALASYTPVVSSYSKGINEVFGDIVLASDDEKALEKELQLLMTDENYYNQKALKGLRVTLQEHTYEQRLHYILQKIGINISENKPKISVLGIVKSQHELNVLLSNFNGQTYDNKEMFLFCYGNVSAQPYLQENVKVLSIQDLAANSNINKLTNGDYISYFAVNNFYGKYFLQDLALAVKYSDASIIGKMTQFHSGRNGIVNSGHEFEYVESLTCDCALIRSDVFKWESTNEVIWKFINNAPLADYFKAGYRLFSIDKYNFIRNTKSATPELIASVEL